MTVGVMVGTLGGTPIPGRLPERSIRRAVGLLLVALGAYMVVAGA